MDDKRRIIKEVYEDPATGLASVNDIYDRIRALGHRNIRLEDIRHYLDDEDAHQVNEERRFVKSTAFKIVGRKIGDCQADIMFYQKSARINKGHNAILIVVELNSRFLIAMPLKNKSAESITTCLRAIIENAPFRVTSLTTDEGTEFKNRQVKALCDDWGIVQHFARPSDHRKMGIIDRLIRTLRGRFNRLFVLTGRHKWFESLPDVVVAYNTTHHTTIGTTPYLMIQDAERMHKQMLEKQQHNHDVMLNNEIRIGDKVRHIVRKGKLEKGASTFTKEIYTVKGTAGFSFILADSDGDELKKRYRTNELLKSNIRD